MFSTTATGMRPAPLFVFYKRNYHTVKQIATDYPIMLMVSGIEKPTVVESILTFGQRVGYQNTILNKIERQRFDTANAGKNLIPFARPLRNRLV